MILYSGTGHVDTVAAAFPGEDVVTIDTIDELRDALDGADRAVFVVDPETIDTEAVEEVRQTTDRTVPTVLLSDDPEGVDLDFDAVAGDDPNADEIRTAVERARRVAAYRESVDELYDYSRQHTTGEFNTALLDTRREADQRFADLPPLDSVTIDVLLRERDRQ
ncbi:hypothetical protein [Halospeciosus flavus]|uniref:Uncharacterized protein n=1 Tax=Halospeciosus flavus TaxID=3032283 RepID=A0ABD5Z5H5_9EURY|nr:hypothetical protein [Halospeciosus flavus]